MRRSLDMGDKAAKDEKWRETERQYHENRRRAEERGELPKFPAARSSECCNVGVFFTKQAVVCKKCGKVQE